MAAKKPARVLNEAETHVWLFNPTTGATWACGLEAAEVYVEHFGWEYATEAPDDSLDGLFDRSTAEGEAQTGFDPAEHTVDEVNAHLAEHADSAPGEVERVLSLEAAGQNRKTIVDPRGSGEDAGESGEQTGD